MNALDDRAEVVLYDGTKATVYYEKGVAGDNNNSNDKKDNTKDKSKEKLQGVTKKKDNNKKDKKKTKTIICQTFGSNSITRNTGTVNFF